MHARRRRLWFRALGAGALLLIVAASVTDVTITHFWDRNSMLTGVIADVLVLLVGVAVINEWLDIRATERWRTVARYALVELVYASRSTWVRLCHALDLHDGRDATVDELAERVKAPGGADVLQARAAQLLADPVRRGQLRALVTELSDQTRDTVTSWAPVMITTGPSADAINRFTRLHGRLMRLRFVLEKTIEGHRIPYTEIDDDEWAARRVATLVRMGAQLAARFHDEAYELMAPEEWGDEPAFVEGLGDA
ncbi:MAG: hypothetical protein ACJ76K_07630 [Solirubrobacteraceae bacterium]